MKNTSYYFSLKSLLDTTGLTLTQKRNIAACIMSKYLSDEATSKSFKLTSEENNAQIALLGAYSHQGYKVTLFQKDVLVASSFAFKSLLAANESQEEIGKAVLLIIENSDQLTLKKNKHNNNVYSVVVLSLERLKDLKDQEEKRSLRNSANRSKRVATPVMYGSLKEDSRIVDYIAFPPDQSEKAKRERNFIDWWAITPTNLRVKKRTVKKIFLADSFINDQFAQFQYRYECYLEETGFGIAKEYRKNNLEYLSNTNICHKGLESIRDILVKPWVRKSV